MCFLCDCMHVGTVRHARMFLDDIPFLKAGLSGNVLYQQVGCQVEQFFCPFLQWEHRHTGCIYLKENKATTVITVIIVLFLQNIYLGCLLLEGHEVQIGDVDHVRATYYSQHPVLHLSCQRADIQELPQLGVLSEETQWKTMSSSSHLHTHSKPLYCYGCGLVLRQICILKLSSQNQTFRGKVNDPKQ